MTDVPYSETIEFLKRRERERQSDLEKRFQEAWRDFEHIVSYIIKEHNPKRIWQWGSLLERQFFSEVSDIDIAVEGLDLPDRIFTILAKTETLTAFPVDIVEMEKIEPEFREMIKRKGKCIYGDV